MNQRDNVALLTGFSISIRLLLKGMRNVPWHQVTDDQNRVREGEREKKQQQQQAQERV